MKPQIFHQEILLNAAARFFKRKGCLKNNNNPEKACSSSLEQLEKVCWPGLLFDFLPEPEALPSADCKIYLWQTLIEDHFLLIQRGPCPAFIEKGLSLDPYAFVSSAYFN